MEGPDPEQINQELLPFLSVDARLDLRVVAVQYFVGLTGSDSGKQFIASDDKYLNAIVDNSEDGSQPVVQKDALLTLVNLSTENDLASKILDLPSKPDLVYNLLKYALASDSVHADIACSLLSNLSRSEENAKKIVREICLHQEDVGFHKIVSVFGVEDYNKHSKLHHLAMLLGNLTQEPDTRQYLLDKERCVIQRLLPFTSYQASAMRRGGVVAVIRNCCFDTAYHDWLLGNEVDILPRLLLPLAGGEEFDEDDMEKLPDDLQYLEPDKKRETDPDIRILLLEAITQLCTTKRGRDYIKSKNAYVILRELHRWEKDPAALNATEKLVQILIGDEPEPGMENFNEVEIPEDIESKLDKARQETERQIEEETQKLEAAQSEGQEMEQPGKQEVEKPGEQEVEQPGKQEVEQPGKQEVKQELEQSKGKDDTMES